MAEQSINTIVHFDRHGNVREERKLTVLLANTEGDSEIIAMSQKGVTEIKNELQNSIPTKVSELANDAEYATATEVLEEINSATEGMFKEKLDNVNGKASVLLKGDLPFGEQVTMGNAIYIVRHDFDLDGTIVVPDDCVLKFKGGSLYNGTLRGRNITIHDGILRNVRVIPTDYVRILNTDFYINNGIIGINLSGRQDDGTQGDGCSALIDGCRFFCEDAGYIVEYENKIYSGNINITVRDCIFKGSTKAYHRDPDEYGNIKPGYAIHAESTDGSNSTEVHLINNDIGLSYGSPYFVNKCNYAKVVGGTYTSDMDKAACNLYSCEKAEIRGGYYHDMNRGATLGGRIGCNGFVVNTINENMKYSGISIDYAAGTRDDEQGTPETYGERRVIVSGNVILNCKYGMYLQVENALITNNHIKGGEYSIPQQGSPSFGIRVNNFNPDNNENIVISNNIIDYTGMNVNPIHLGANTKAIIVGNSSYSNNNIAGERTCEIKTTPDTLIVEDGGGRESIYVPQNVTYVLVKERGDHVDLRFMTTDAYDYLRQPVFVCNGSTSKLIVVHAAGVSNAIFGESYIPPQSCALVIKVAWNKFFVQMLGYYGTTSQANREKRRYPQGYCCFEYDLGKPIWLKNITTEGSTERYTWVYADGTTAHSDELQPEEDSEEGIGE